MSKLTPVQRELIPDLLFAENRKFPLHSKEYVYWADRLSSFSDLSDAGKDRIRNKCVRFDVSPNTEPLSETELEDITDPYLYALQDILANDVAVTPEIATKLLDIYQSKITNGDSFYCTETTLFKLPVGKLGTWYRPNGKKVSFAQSDFDQMIANFEDDVLGFFPYICKGHDTEEDNFGGTRSYGIIVALAQEEDILYAYATPTGDRSAVWDVKDKTYRYTSAEFVRNHRSKRTFKNVGTILTALALTNSPFVPNMPETEVFSDFFKEDPMTTEKDEQVTWFERLSDQFKEIKTMLSDSFQKQNEPTPQPTKETDDMTNLNDLVAQAVQAALEPMNVKLSEMGSALDEKSTQVSKLESDLSAAKSELETAKNNLATSMQQTELFSQNAESLRVEKVRQNAINAGIPAVLVNNMLSFRNQLPEKVKLSDASDEVDSLNAIEKILLAVPMENRVQFSQYGATQTPEQSPYEDFKPKSQSK